MKDEYTSQEEVSVNIAGTLTVVLISALFLAVGLVMMIFPQMKLVYFSYATGCILLLCGIWFIARYFKNEEYKKITNYGFSAGTLIVILGCCTLIRAEDIAQSVSVYLGILILIEAVVMLQSAVQLKNLKGTSWMINLIFAFISIIGALIVILDVASIISRYQIVLYVILVLVGIFGILSFMMVAVRMKRYHSEVLRQYERNMEEASQMQEKPLWTEEKEEQTEKISKDTNEVIDK